MSNLVDIGDIAALDVWGDAVQARVVVGANASLAVVELAPGAVVIDIFSPVRADWASLPRSATGRARWPRDRPAPG